MRSRWLVLSLSAAVLCFGVVVLSDVARLAEVLAVAPRHTPGVLLASFGMGARFLWPSVAYAALLSFLLAASPTRPWQRRVLFALHGVAATLACLAIHYALGRYAPFRSFAPAIAALALLCIVLWALFFGVERGFVSRASPRLRRAGAALGALGVVSFVTLDHLMYPRLYGTMHLAFLQLAVIVAFVGCVIGFAPAREASAHERSSSLGLRIAVGAALLTVALSITGTLLGASLQAAQGLVRASTTLGQAPDALGLRRKGIRGRKVRLDTGPWAEQYFVARSGLPQLGAQFRLDEHDVLLITIEATRYDFTTLASPTKTTTPRLAEFASQGAFTFTRAYSPSSGTLHSISALLAMSFPSSVALRASQRPWWGTLDDSEHTVAEIFRDAGRATFWSAHDVDWVFSKLRINGFEQGFDPKWIWHARSRDAIADRRIVDHGLEFIRYLEKKGRRYFGWLFLESPHGPYYAHEGPRDAGKNVQRYRSELRFMDAHLGRLLDELRKSGALEHTVVIIAGDHGEEFKDHGGMFHKATVYDEVTHVPLVIWVPGQRGTRLTQPTSLTYVLPWLLRHGSGGVRAAAQARITDKLVPMMRATHDAVIAELIGHDRMHTTLVYPRYKLNYDLFADHAEVFDLTVDPREKNDLLLRQDHQALALLPSLEAYLNVRHTLARFEMDKPKKKKKREKDSQEEGRTGRREGGAPRPSGQFPSSPSGQLPAR